VPIETAAAVVDELTSRGYNAHPEAVTLIARADDPAAAIERAIAAAPETALRITPDHVRDGLDTDATSVRASARQTDTEVDPTASDGTSQPSNGTPAAGTETSDVSPVETGGSSAASVTRDPVPVTVANDVTGRSTGTGAYADFVAVFRDRYERLADSLRSRVNHRPASVLRDQPGGGDGAIVGLVDDIGSTKNGHHIIELEDTTGTFRCLVTKDRDFAHLVSTLLLDEVIAIEGTLSDDGEIMFADAIHFPDVPRTHSPSTADRHVQAALISDVHVGSQEFLADAWHRFADWLHTEEAAAVEYLCIAGDMVEGVGVYPNQDEELDVIDIYDQYETFAEHLERVPEDIEIVMIPGNHDAVRLAEPQPGFDDDIRDILSVHDARIVGNPAMVTIEGVSILMYHGVSLDEVIAETPDVTYDDPHEAMYQLLRKRHLGPQYGGRMRLAPEERDYLVIDEVPDIFHTGHVHKLGYGEYHNVLTINSGCWQSQTAFQEKVDIEPDAGFAPIVDLDTLDVTIRQFAP
jgi:DNA polymerase II small subunit